MSGPHSRVHEQIVELLTKAHTSSDTMEAKIQALQQATELLLFHTAGNERIDEFLETFLSMHVSRDSPLRRFCAHFIELLCFTRSRFACSCLEVLVSLLQDQDKQVQIFALRAARVVYKRALYWISIQQREAMFVPAARESVDTLDHVLARIVHLITSSNREVFCEAIRCAQSIILSQSYSNFAAKSQAQLESVGASCLEDLRLLDTTALDEAKLKGQADRLFTALCALLIKKKEENASEMEIVSLINAVGLIGHERGSYAGAATVGFTQLVEDIGSAKKDGRLGEALVTGLKRILSSRHCISWQPRIIPVLARMGIVDPSTTVDSTGVVMEAEVERMRQQVEAEMGSSFEQHRLKRRKLSPEENGERLMMISDIADSFKVPDEEHAVAICSVRAQSPGELAKLALAMLGRLPKKFDDQSAMAITKVVRGAGSTSAGQSIGFENRVKAVRSMGIAVTDFVDGGDLSDEEGMDIVTPGDESVPSIPKPSLVPSSESVDVKSLIDLSQVDLFCKLLFSLRISDDEKRDLVGRFIAFHMDRRSIQPVSKLMLASLTKSYDVEDIGASFVEVITRPEQTILFAEVKPMILELPVIPTAILDYLNSTALNVEEDVSVRRNALTTLSALFFSRPGLAENCLTRLVEICSSENEGIRNDSLKLVLSKVYKPLDAVLLSWQWPYSDACSLEVVKSLTGKVSKMDLLCSQTIETVAKERFSEAIAAKADWNKAWLLLALCSKKPILIHCVLASLVEGGEVSLPSEIVKSFGQSLTLLSPGLIDNELEVAVRHYKSVRAAAKKKARNDFLLPILSAISTTDRGLTSVLAEAALSFSK